MEEETTIRRITLHPLHDNSTIDDVIRLLRDLTPTEKIDLTLLFMDQDGFRFNETVELRELAFEKKSQIHCLKVINGIDIFVHVLEANKGDTKHFKFSTICSPPRTKTSIQIEHVNRLSDAILSNTNCIIESFTFSGCCDSSSEVLQPVWDALLTINVQDIKLDFVFSENNGVNGGNTNIDFSNISTNTALKELEVQGPLDMTNLFDSMKGNQTVEKLSVKNRRVGCLQDKYKEIGALKEMLCKNITLIDVTVTDGNLHSIMRNTQHINVHTKFNRMWTRYLVVKRKERIAAAAAIATISTTTPTDVVTITDDANVDNDNVEKKKKIEEEQKMIKKKKDMYFWLTSFEKKPAICNELIYLFLTEHAGDMYNTNNNVTSSIAEETRKRKRQKNITI